jgi:hypothetical protein
LYYPAASACFAYQPRAAGLIDKFKAHNWFLPSSGELSRICYYAYQSYKDGVAQAEPVNSAFDSAHTDPANAFYAAIRDGKMLMGDLAKRTLWSSTEGSASSRNAIVINAETGVSGSVGLTKQNSNYVRPVCKF